MGEWGKEEMGIEDVEYYIVYFVFNNTQKYYTIWHTSVNEGFVLCEDTMHIKTFKEESALKEFAKEYNYKLEEDITEILCDESKLLNYEDLNCDRLLMFWNIVSDVARTVNVRFSGDSKENAIASIYNKLFYGCNLPAVREEDSDFCPKWLQCEMLLTERIVKEGLKILTEEIVLPGGLHTEKQIKK